MASGYETSNEILDRICKSVRGADSLNALHSCREGHPWNKDNKTCWRNAYGIVRQNYGIAWTDEEFVRKQADRETQRFPLLTKAGAQ